MNSREKILNAIAKSGSPLRTPHVPESGITVSGAWERFIDTLTSIGGAAIKMPSHSGVREYVLQHFGDHDRIISTIPLDERSFRPAKGTLHPYDNVEAMLLEGHFGVAENGAVWITSDQVEDRVLPFICQHLMVVIDIGDIVSTMHEAYKRIGAADYDFGIFIAGPSKTADIEQSLVLGAHGPKTMTVFLLENSG